MADGPVRLEGLRELQAALRAYDGTSQRQLRAIFNRAAGRVTRAAERLATTPVQRALAAGVRPKSDQRSIAVGIGGSRMPEGLGAEFGANRNRTRSRVGPGRSRSYVGYRQFREHTGTAGTVIYPAIRLERDQVVQDALAMIDDFLTTLEG